MKTLEFENCGLQEMNALEMKSVDGGSEPAAHTYMTSAQMQAAGKAIVDAVDYIAGFCNGLFGL